MRKLLAVMALFGLVALAACSGDGAVLLAPGAGPGEYSGDFTDGAGADIGDFTLRVRESGRLTGSGTLGAFEVQLRGVLHPSGAVDAFITEADSQRSGGFDGQRNGSTLSGSWRFDPTGAQELQGDWAAALNP